MTHRPRGRNLKMEGATEVYILKLSRIFFTQLKEDCLEFAVLFRDAELKSCMSCYTAACTDPPFYPNNQTHVPVCVAWVRDEVEVYMQIFARQVIMSATNSFSNVAACVDIACRQSKQVQCLVLCMLGYNCIIVRFGPRTL